MEQKRGSYSMKQEGHESFSIKAAVGGVMIPIEDVRDEVFSQKMVGDGFAIEPESNDIVAPVSGTLIRIAETGHAFYIQLNQHLKVMVHVGINTLMLKGEGFHTEWEAGMPVEAGETLVTVDRDMLEEKGYNPVISVVVIDNAPGTYQYVFHENGPVKAGESVALELHGTEES
ncbi:PTS sugar transporter subunit IIA [Atopococcus tabaci]|uniref:PTS sugar transporter subunit IIA n=1 Tax=Atopococcus tabaci TaxID=269774 RepID=UPI002409BE7E|nr:glucose PTS transporter subunit IIA [Atopococcus tabaci]